MDLQEFVTSTLVQIVNGVAEARDQIATGATGASVNTRLRNPSASVAVAPPQPVEFDVAITVSTEATAGVKSGIKVAVFNFGAEAGARSTSEAVSRVKFAVQLSQPGDFIDRPEFRPVPVQHRWQE